MRPGRRGIRALPLILETHHPLDAVIVMFGTNDCKPVYCASAYTIRKGLEYLKCTFKIEIVFSERVLKSERNNRYYPFY